MRIDIEEINKIEKRRKEINAIPLNEIEVYENGERVYIDPEVLESWRFSGMGNWYFLADGYYCEPIIDITNTDIVE
jgi:hypothetical protein